MKNSNLQAPGSREIPNTKSQNRLSSHDWSLKLGASLVVGAWCLALFFTPETHAQQYSVDWFKIAGGGGTSTNGQFALSGTIGQPEANTLPLTGGNYSLTGGFWSLFAVQTLGAPALRIFLTGTNSAVIAWPASATGYVLQQNSNLASNNWSRVANPVSTVGNENQVMISPTMGNQFFRLH